MRCTRPVLERCKNGPVEIVERPCGVCPNCRSNRAQEWTYRLYAENKLHKKSCFVTLTFNEENIKKLKCSPTGLYSLDKKSLQNFMKRLRKNLSQRIRFYAVGEYGETTRRPHYHLILFGVGDNDRLTIERSWPYGFVKVGDVTPSSIAYVARYCTKKLFSESLDYESEGILPEFSLMSNRPGIGFNAIEKGVNSDKDGNYYVWYQGRRAGLPKYFKEKVRNAYESYVARLRSRESSDERRNESDLDPYGSYERDLQREKNTLARRKSRRAL